MSLSRVAPDGLIHNAHRWGKGLLDTFIAAFGTELPVL
jgi:hypothetical protein